MQVVRLGGRGWDCNQFLIKDPRSNRFDLIDAGHGQDFERVLKEVVAVTDPHRIGTVALTHEHLDHVNGIPQWQALGATVAASPACAQKLLVGHDPTSAAFGMDIVRVDVDRILDDEEDIILGGADHRVLLTPGHAPGSACYWHEPSATLYAGDTLFAQGGIGRFDFPDSDLHQLHESIQRLERLPVRLLHCGHGPSEEGDAAKRSVHGSLANVASCL